MKEEISIDISIRAPNSGHHWEDRVNRWYISHFGGSHYALVVHEQRRVRDTLIRLVIRYQQLN